MKNKNNTLKWIGLGVMAVYFWSLARQNGGTLSGNKEGYQVSFDSDLAMDMLATPLYAVNPYIATVAKNAGKRWFKRKMGNRYGIKW